MDRTTAHIIREETQRLVRDALRKHGVLSKESSFFGGGGGSLAPGDAGDGGADDGGEGFIGPTGLGLTAWPVEELDYADAESRLRADEEWLARLVALFRGVPEDGGHRHTGTHGDGPPLPAASVLLPDGHVGEGSTLADHLKDTTLHGSSGGGRALLFDDFETEDQDTRWEVLAGVPVLETELSGNHRWVLPTGVVFQARGGLFTWNDRVIVRFELKLDGSAPGGFEVKLRTRPDATGYTYVVGLSNSGNCYLAELNNATNVLQDLANGPALANDGLFHVIEIGLFGATLSLNYDGNQVEALIGRDDREDPGALTFFNASGVEAALDNLLVHRGGGGITQIINILEYDGSPLDVADLTDVNGRLLTGPQRSDLTDGGETTLHTHPGISPLTTDPPPPVGYAEVAGTAGESARADHVHAVPHWLMEYYLHANVGAFYPVDDVDFDANPMTTLRRQRMPTLDGSFHWSTYGKGIVWRATLQIENTSGADRTVNLIFPLVAGVVRLRLKNSLDGNLNLLFHDQGEERWNYIQPVVLRAGLVNSLVLYGAASRGFSNAIAQWWMAPADAAADLFDPSQGLRWVSG